MSNAKCKYRYCTLLQNITLLIVSYLLSLSSIIHSQAVLVDKTLYISGQLGTDDNGQLLDGIQAQTRRTLDKIGFVLNAAGASFKDGKANILVFIKYTNESKDLI